MIAQETAHELGVRDGVRGYLVALHLAKDLEHLGRLVGGALERAIVIGANQALVVSIGVARLAELGNLVVACGLGEEIEALVVLVRRLVVVVGTRQLLHTSTREVVIALPVARRCCDALISMHSSIHPCTRARDVREGPLDERACHEIRYLVNHRAPSTSSCS